MDHLSRSARNGFARFCLERGVELRHDAAWVTARQSDARSRYVVTWRSLGLCARGEPGAAALLAPGQLGVHLEKTGAATLLGVEDGRAVFAVDLDAADEAPAADLGGWGEFRSLRELAARLPDRDGALLAQALAYAHWHRRHRFCGECGSPTRVAEAGHVRICTDPACAQPAFPRTDPAVIVIVSRGDACLLGRQAGWPEGLYSAVAGFVEPGESLEAAVVREVREETGIDVTEVWYHSSQPWPFPGSIMIGFSASAGSGQIRRNDGELADARWFTRAAIAEELRRGRLRLPSSFSIARRLIEDWYDQGDAGALQRLAAGARGARGTG